jgi:hypothetical protein
MKTINRVREAHLVKLEAGWDISPCKDAAMTYNRYETALFLQNACNLRAIARELVRAADEACEQGGGTAATYTDPAVTLIVNKLESLVRSEQRFSEAYQECCLRRS